MGHHRKRARSLRLGPVDHNEFRRYISETLEWCAARFSMFDLAGSLRSAELRPGRDIINCTGQPEILNSTVWAVIRQRSALLAAQGHGFASAKRSHHLAGGNLLVACPQGSLSHGLSVGLTGGFIDGDEIPPWDTWIYFSNNRIVSWVPHNLISAVSSAIECNAEGCISWLCDSEPELAKVAGAS